MQITCEENNEINKKLAARGIENLIHYFDPKVLVVLTKIGTLIMVIMVIISYYLLSYHMFL